MLRKHRRQYYRMQRKNIQVYNYFLSNPLLDKKMPVKSFEEKNDIHLVPIEKSRKFKEAFGSETLIEKYNKPILKQMMMGKLHIFTEMFLRK